MKTLLITTIIIFFSGVNLTSIEKNENNLIETISEETPCIGTRLNDCVEICIYNTSQTIKYNANGSGGVVDIWIMGCGPNEVYYCDDCPITGNISRSQFGADLCVANPDPCTNYTITITYKKNDGTHCSQSANFCW